MSENEQSRVACVFSAIYYSHFFISDLAGDIHFDDDETYTIRSPKGKDLLWVAVHELGHSIGLDHSSAGGAVMNAWYQATDGKDFNLSPDDIKGAQSLYGKYQHAIRLFCVYRILWREWFGSFLLFFPCSNVALHSLLLTMHRYSIRKACDKVPEGL